MNVKRKVNGLSVMLLSLILLIGFNNLSSDSFDWRYVFDLSLTWQEVWMILGIIGFVMVVWDGKKKKSVTKQEDAPTDPPSIRESNTNG